MHRSALIHGKLFFETYASLFDEAKIVDIGAQNVNGSLKDVCPSHFNYCGVDSEAGNGVDVVLTDPNKLPFDDESVDIVVSNSCFEHSEFFWLIYLEIIRILKPNGLFYLNVPSNGYIHRYPVDCWRFYPDSGRALVSWAQKNGFKPALLESFVGKHSGSVVEGEAWNDFIAVIVKDRANKKLYPDRIISNVSHYTNGILSENEFINPSVNTQDESLIIQHEREIDKLKQIVRERDDKISHLNQVIAEREDKIKKNIDITNQSSCQFITDEQSGLLESFEEKSGGHDTVQDSDMSGRQDKIYPGVIDLREENNSHSKMYKFINEDACERNSRILEVGCSSGYFGKALKQNGHEVWGVEISRQAVELARLCLDHVFHGTIEEFLCNKNSQDIKFDYIVFGDVLEHLTDPLKILKDCRRILSHRGAIVASIPNVAHRAVRAMLMEGRWDYDDMGIMDNTHLRFFTRKTIVDLFTHGDYEITEMETVILPAESTGIDVDFHFLEDVAPMMKGSDLETFQFVLLGRKGSSSADIARSNVTFKAPSIPHVLCLLPLKEWSIGKIRLQDPLTEFQRRYSGEVRFATVSDYKNSDLNWADTIIFQREANKQVENLILHIQKSGKRVVFDIDDLLTDVPDFLAVSKKSKEYLPYLENVLGMVDAITVATPHLKKELLRYNSNIYVVPNCVSSPYEPVEQGGDKKNVNLLIASSDTVRVDFMVSIFERIQSCEELNVRLVAVGPPGQTLLNAGLEVTVHENLTYDQFKHFLSTHENTIGIIPLDDSNFSRCKSPVKFLDYALAGIPSICSDVPPYSDIIIEGKTGILCKNEDDEWFNAIKRLVMDASSREFIANSARQFSERDYDIRHSADVWKEVIEKVSPYCNDAVQSAKVARPPSRGVLSLCMQLMKPQTYSSVYRVFKREGVKGILVRLRWFV